MGSRAPKEEERGLPEQTGLRENVCNLNLAAGYRSIPLRKPRITDSQVKSSPGRGSGLHKGPEVRKIDAQAVPTLLRS